MLKQRAYIGRQPIMDASQKIVAYELFFRHDGAAHSAVFQDDIEAFTRVLVSAISDMGSQWLLGDKLAFINVSADMLDNEFLELLPPATTVLELPADTPPTAALAARCQALREQGFRIALKDKGGEAAAPAALLACADFVKLDMLVLDAPTAAARASAYRAAPLALVAERVETRAQFDLCAQLGLDMTQGYYFARTETFTAKVVHPDFGNVLDLLNLVSRDADLIEMEQAFKRDPTLSFKLLRYINSVGFGLSCEIQSIRHALTIIGIKRLYRWLTLLMVTASEHIASPALMKTSITRGRLTELLGKGYFDKSGCDNLFVVGVFSSLDTMLNMPMDMVLEQVDLPEPVQEALLQQDGIYGPFLKLALACEQADGAGMAELAQALHMDPDKVNDCHIAALSWVEGLAA